MKNVCQTFLRSILQIIGFAVAAFVLISSSSQAATMCNKFDPVPSPLSSQWIPCPTASAVTLSTSNNNSISGVSDFYLRAEDESGASAICSSSTNPILGDWTKGGDCSEFCFDAQAFDNYDGTLRTMSTEINSGLTKRFVFPFT